MIRGLCLLTMLAFLSCKDPMTFQSILKKSIVYEYGEDHYNVFFDTDSTLHWEAIKGAELGVKGDELYHAEFVGPDQLFITWSEANGIGVSQVLDFSTNKVYNHLIKGRSIQSGIGKIRLTD